MIGRDCGSAIATVNIANFEYGKRPAGRLPLADQFHQRGIDQAMAQMNARHAKILRQHLREGGAGDDALLDKHFAEDAARGLLLGEGAGQLFVGDGAFLNQNVADAKFIRGWCTSCPMKRSRECLEETSHRGIHIFEKLEM